MPFSIAMFNNQGVYFILNICFLEGYTNHGYGTNMTSGGFSVAIMTRE